MTSRSDETEGIRAQTRLIVTHAPTQRFDQHGAELLQVRGTVVDASRRHPMVVVRFAGKHQADLYRWASPGKHLAVDGYLRVESWTTADNRTGLALLIEARDIFPLNDPDTSPSRLGITSRPSTHTARRAPTNGSDVVEAPTGADRADMLRRMLADG